MLTTRFILLALLTMVAIFTSFHVYSEKTGIAPYTTLLEDGKMELRQYPKMILVSAPMGESKSRNSAFKELFAYISGENDAEQKIPMTAPVFMDVSDGEMENMAFVMPESMPLTEMPKPAEDSLSVTETGDTTFATIRFSGRLTQKNIEGHKEKLMAWIISQKLEISGGVKTAGYNGPFTLPMFRRNEVLIPVKNISSSELSSK